jgi:ribosome-associated protein
MTQTSPAQVDVLARRAASLCLEYKANDVVMLNLASVSDMTDYFIVASGTSDTHVRSIAEHLMADLKKEGVRIYHVEGLQQGRWVLLDYVDFVVHIFHPTLRAFYQLERLWSDAEVIHVEDPDPVT